MVRTEARTRRHASNISEHEYESTSCKYRDKGNVERERETERSEIREEQTTLNKQIPPRRTESASFQLHRETSDATRHKGALQRRLLRTRTNHSPAVRWQLTSVQSAHIQMWVWRRRWTTSFRGKKRSSVVRVSFCLFDIQNEKMIKKRFVISYFAHHYHFYSTLDFMLRSLNMELMFVTLPWWRVYPPSFSSQTAFSEICGSIKSWWRSDDRAEEEAHTVHSSQDHWHVCEWLTSFSHFFFEIIWFRTDLETAC